MAMMKRQPLFPHVIELNHQARRRISCSVYLIYDDANNWALIDIGYEDAVDDILEIIRQLDFPFSKCVTLIASHADVDHIQGFAKAKQILKTTVTAHPLAAKPLESGDKLATFRRDRRPKYPPRYAGREGRKPGQGRRPHPHRQRRARGLAHARPHRRPALIPAGQPAASRATTCSAMAASGRSTPTMAAAFQTSSSRCNAFVPATLNGCFPAMGPCSARTTGTSTHDRPAGNLPPHGRLWHLRDRLAADGPVGTRAGRRQDAAIAPCVPLLAARPQARLPLKCTARH